MVDPKYGATGAQLSAATRRAITRRRKLTNSGATPKLENPINRNPSPMKPKFGKAPSTSMAPRESVPRLDGTVDSTPGTVSRGSFKSPGKTMGSGGPTINRTGSAPTIPPAQVDAKYGMDVNKTAKKKRPMGVDYGAAMDRGIRKAMRLPLA